MKTEQNVEKIVLFGHKIHIHHNDVKTEVLIFNEKSVPFYDFKSVSDLLVQYLIDEAFVEKKSMTVKVVTPKADPK